MSNRYFYFFLFVFCSDAMGAELCSSGRVAMMRSDSIVPRLDCGSAVAIGVADTLAFPQIACGGDMSVLEVGGAVVSVYSEKYSERALHMRRGDNICYVNFVSGDIDKTLHVKYDGQIYSAQDARLCFVARADAGASLVQSMVDSVNWKSVLGDVAIKGVSYCSDRLGQDNEVTDALSVVSYNVENLYCWCRTIVPVVSKWVFSMEFASELNCGKYCAARCAEQFVDDVGFRKTLLDNFYMIN